MKRLSRLSASAAGITIAVLAIVVLAADQLSKYFAVDRLTEFESVEVVGEALQWRLVYNPGAAFSLGESVTWIFTIALAVVACIIVFLAITRVRSRAWAVVLGLLLGGVLGNLTDRLVRDPGFGVGHVVDFILTPWMWFWTNPAIYNVADMFIVCGMIAVAVLVLIGINFDGTRGDAEAEAPEADAEDTVTEASDADAEDAELEAVADATGAEDAETVASADDTDVEIAASADAAVSDTRAEQGGDAAETGASADAATTTAQPTLRRDLYGRSREPRTDD
ncbi:MAG TPA: signal peptidase II [Candidatus Microbacterium stercoravium]|uniref:Lipoprotein signal peptidase n=1 Tax=Candidatus Microbacterium stercoravium TaxID=2838697 RepID=A0A9D2KHH8_9MICO|nr:signal peptidase II [Candidatus Microbacterium stercoravium]